MPFFFSSKLLSLLRINWCDDHPLSGAGSSAVRCRCLEPSATQLAAVEALEARWTSKVWSRQFCSSPRRPRAQDYEAQVRPEGGNRDPQLVKEKIDAAILMLSLVLIPRCPWRLSIRTTLQWYVDGGGMSCGQISRQHCLCGQWIWLHFPEAWWIRVELRLFLILTTRFKSYGCF
jgi:hypothetical protein